MIKLKEFTFNPLQVNTYILYDDLKNAVIIDAACYNQTEKNELKKFIDSQNLKIEYVINTHLHFDHIFGNRFISREYGKGPLAHRDDEFLNDTSFALMMGFEVEEPFEPIKGYLSDKQIIKTGKIELHVIHIPGHSPGGLAFYEPNLKYLFTGDILFLGSIGRSDLPGGNYQHLIEGIKSKLYILADDVKVFPGHGPSTTIGDEKKYNPFTV